MESALELYRKRRIAIDYSDARLRVNHHAVLSFIDHEAVFCATVAGSPHGDVLWDIDLILESVAVRTLPAVWGCLVFAPAIFKLQYIKDVLLRPFLAHILG